MLSLPLVIPHRVISEAEAGIDQDQGCGSGHLSQGTCIWWVGVWIDWCVYVQSIATKMSEDMGVWIGQNYTQEVEWSVPPLPTLPFSLQVTPVISDI